MLRTEEDNNYVYRYDRIVPSDPLHGYKETATKAFSQ